MAMEKQYMIREVYTRPLTAVGYNPTRREIMIGCEDGVVKTFEAENGKLVTTFNEHKGLVTDFVHWSDLKLMLSSANDGQILAWGPAGGIIDKVKIGVPVFCMAVLSKRHQLLCGVNGGIRIYKLDDERESGHVLNNKIVYFAREHTDIVRSILCADTRIYSVGYDQRLMIYDISAGGVGLHPVFNNIVHAAGITCLAIANDSDNNNWILTGSFDKSMKVWTMDGNLMHKMDKFMGTVTGICYAPRNKLVWVAGGAPYAWLFDAKSGDNVSQFAGTFQNMEEEKYELQILKYFPELSQAVASTSRRQVVVWKYVTAGCVTVLKCSAPLESICYTSKTPILIFSGDHEGVISKWERNQSNHFMYSKELFSVGDVSKNKYSGNRLRKERAEPEKTKDVFSDLHLQKLMVKKDRPRHSSYAFKKPTVPPPSFFNHPHTSILRIIFIESLDYILAASEDGNIYVWGFDDTAVQVLASMRPVGVESLVEKYSILLDSTSPLLPNNVQQNGSDSVTNRVAGFVCRHVLAEHVNCVTSLVTVERNPKWDNIFVLSGGWDRRICLWNIEDGTLKDVCRASPSTPSIETVCDGIITDMAYSPRNSEFAYASSDKMVYIRKMHTIGQRMFIVNTLQGHEAEVTAVKWNDVYNKWVTGSEDGTIRIWNGAGLNECEQVLSMHKAVTTLCVDQTNGSIVVAVDKSVRVYESDTYCLVQSNLGHMDSVRSVIHIPERQQYVSCSWDHTIRVWNAWKRSRSKRTAKEDKKDALERDITMQYIKETLKAGTTSRDSRPSLDPTVQTPSSNET